MESALFDEIDVGVVMHDVFDSSKSLAAEEGGTANELDFLLRQNFKSSRLSCVFHAGLSMEEVLSKLNSLSASGGEKYLVWSCGEVEALRLLDEIGEHPFPSAFDVAAALSKLVDRFASQYLSLLTSLSLNSKYRRWIVVLPLLTPRSGLVSVAVALQSMLFDRLLRVLSSFGAAALDLRGVVDDEIDCRPSESRKVSASGGRKIAEAVLRALLAAHSMPTFGSSSGTVTLSSSAVGDSLRLSELRQTLRDLRSIDPREKETREQSRLVSRAAEYLRRLRELTIPDSECDEEVEIVEEARRLAADLVRIYSEVS